MTTAPPPGAPSARPTLELAEPLPLWRVWHPDLHVDSGAQASAHGPKARFDPHPPGPVTVHAGGPWVWYGSVQLPTAVCEVHARTAAAVDVCRQWRASLVMLAAGTMLYDLARPHVAEVLHADEDLGDSTTVDYADTQAWARHLHGHADGLQYHSARHRTRPGGDRVGVNVAVFDPDRLGDAVTTVRLHDDAVWPHVTAVLDQMHVAHGQVDRCGRCV